MKYTFEDESSLDALPLEAAGNPGAWSAWRSYRKGIVPDLTLGLSLLPASDEKRSGQALAGDLRNNPRHRDEWSWEGVWEERVQKGIQSSISDAVLYGNLGGSDDFVWSKTRQKA